MYYYGTEQLDQYITQSFEGTVRRLSSDGHHLKLTIYESKSEDIDVDVVYLSGGPQDQTFGAIGVRFILDVYSELNPRITFVEYSGSECCDGLLLDQLREGGLSVLERDAAMLVDFLSRRDRVGEDVPLIIHTASFSTPIGLMVLSSDRTTQDCQAGVFVAPWVRYYPSSFVYDPNRPHMPDMKRTIAQRQADWKEANLYWLHIDEEVDVDPARMWLERVRNGAEITSPIFVAIPEFENRSDREEVYKYFSEMPGAKVQIVRSMFHDSMAASSEARSAIKKFASDQVRSCEAYSDDIVG